MSDSRNFMLIELLPHSMSYDLKKTLNEEEPEKMYQEIISKFEHALGEATSNVPSIQSLDSRKRLGYSQFIPKETYQLGFTQKDKNDISYGSCTPDK